MRDRPPATLKALLAAVEARFLAQIRPSAALLDLMPAYVLRRHPERFAEVVSMVLAEAVEFSSFRAVELNHSVVEASSM